MPEKYSSIKHPLLTMFHVEHYTDPKNGIQSRQGAKFAKKNKRLDI